MLLLLQRPRLATMVVGAVREFRLWIHLKTRHLGVLICIFDLTWIELQNLITIAGFNIAHPPNRPSTEGLRKLRRVNRRLGDGTFCFQLLIIQIRLAHTFSHEVLHHVWVIFGIFPRVDLLQVLSDAERDLAILLDFWFQLLLCFIGPQVIRALRWSQVLELVLNCLLIALYREEVEILLIIGRFRSLWQIDGDPLTVQRCGTSFPDLLEPCSKIIGEMIALIPL